MTDTQSASVLRDSEGPATVPEQVAATPATRQPTLLAFLNALAKCEDTTISLRKNGQPTGARMMEREFIRTKVKDMRTAKATPIETKPKKSRQK